MISINERNRILEEQEKDPRMVTLRLFTRNTYVWLKGSGDVRRCVLFLFWDEKDKTFTYEWYNIYTGEMERLTAPWFAFDGETTTEELETLRGRQGKWWLFYNPSADRTLLYR